MSEAKSRATARRADPIRPPVPLQVLRVLRGLCTAAGVGCFLIAFESSSLSASAARALDATFAGLAITLTLLPVLEWPWQSREEGRHSRWIGATITAITVLGALLVQHDLWRTWLPGADPRETAPLLPWWWRLTVLVWVCLGMLAVFRSVAFLGWSPATLLVLSFLTVILVGAGLLMSPYARADQRRTEFNVALFTATSATCVTGLTVVDTGRYWSRTGQVIILSLIQIGGLGIMTYGAFFSVLAGRGLLLRETALLSQLLEQRMLHRVRGLIFSILATTVTCELVGACLLSGLWPDLPWPTRMYYAVFHSVSAFCNAGFGLHTDNLERFATRWQVYGVVSSLIIFGGIGFIVLDNLRQVGADLLRQRVFGRRRRPTEPVVRLALTSKLVLTSTVLLLLGGTVGILLLEQPGMLHDRPRGEQLAVAWFHSVSCRTAGFNSIPLGPLREATKVLMIVLMFIGAAPGSTGGGVKTTSVVVAWFAFRAVLRGRHQVEAWNRTIPESVVYRAFLVVSLAMLLVVGLTIALLITESHPGQFLDYLFEVVSALGTVGLSTGVTGSISLPGQAILIVAMFIGRIGPLTLFVSLASRVDTSRYRYPEETVMLG